MSIRVTCETDATCERWKRRHLFSISAFALVAHLA
jgi:hypothetical protein